MINNINTDNDYLLFLETLKEKNVKIYHYVIYDRYIGKNRLQETINGLNKNKIQFKDLYSKIPKLYDNLEKNYHHWTTDYCWSEILPIFIHDLNIHEFKQNDFKLIKNIVDDSDLSYHDLIQQNKCYDYVNIQKNIFLKDITQSDLRYFNTEYLTPYHQLFIGSHQMCRIFNKENNSTRKLLLNCDSMSVPFIPLLAPYFNEIFICDNRHQQTFLNEIKSFNPTHYVCMLTVNNYSVKKYIQNLT